MPASPPLRPVAVLGAGVTGLAAAWHLQRAGAPVVVLEAASRAGGAIQTWRDGGWLHEGGPNSLLESGDDLAALLQGTGLSSRQLFAGPEAKNRFVLKRGRLVAMPVSPPQFLTTRLFSLRAKLGLAAELFRPKRTSPEEESVADFTRRRLGREFLDYAVDPFVGGVYAGDPSRLSVRHGFPKLYALEQQHGSLLRGAAKLRNASGGPKGRIFSFPEGMEELPRALAQPLGEALRLRSRVVALNRVEDGWRVTWESDGRRLTGLFAAVIATVTAPALCRLDFEGTLAPAVLAPLASIEHPPVASVFTGYRREDVAHPLDGFGLLVPRVENRGFLGTLFSSSLFPGRAPAGHVALTTFVGGARQPALGVLDDEALARHVRQELRTLLGLRGAPAIVRVSRHPRAIPQYALGYDTVLSACERAEGAAPGLFIGGNFRGGISVSACLATGQRLAVAAAAAYARSPAP